MKVVRTELASAQLREGYLYYKEVASAKVASTIKSRIYENTRKLSDFPELGQKENNPLIESIELSLPGIGQLQNRLPNRTNQKD